ncbi:beta-lactamase/transpeptidase-like protein [Hortaea werneckii]|nr:beta-lactamase/transpeptidase-like protein [Hortaea werneckii]
MVNQKAQDSVQSLLDSVTKDPKTGIPGLVFVAIGKDGKQIAAHASGKTGLAEGRPPMTLDTVFWIASCTKLLATIACMQAFEQGKLKLDDSHFVYTLCPELQKVKVLQDDGKLVDKKTDITLRMLLTHTAGFGYEFFNPKLRDYGRPVGFDVFHGDEKEILRMPLVNQPGERFEYGISIDWAGIVLERATGVKLNDWIQDNIMKPLKLENVNIKDGQANPESARRETTSCVSRCWHRPITRRSTSFTAAVQGLMLSQQLVFTEYVQVLAALLNDGTSPNTGAQILKKHTVDEMFTNQIPSFHDDGRAGRHRQRQEYRLVGRNSEPVLVVRQGERRGRNDCQPGHAVR